MTNEDDIRKYLFSNDPDFRRMVEEHRSYDQKLQVLNDRNHVSGEEQFEEVNIKKRKLFLKDQMSRMIQEYRHAQASG